MHKKIVLHFKKVDPVLHSYIKKVEMLKIAGHIAPRDYFVSLCREIIGQQLSGKAARTIFDRFVKLFPTNKLTPKNVLKISDQKMRDAGLSWSKVKYIKDLAQKVTDKTIDLENLKDLSDDKVIEKLTIIKGIGRWTAEMFLMFSLHREDIFSQGDLGLQKGIMLLYKLEKPTKKEIEEITKKWSPYKSYASIILWRVLDLKSRK